MKSCSCHSTTPCSSCQLRPAPHPLQNLSRLESFAPHSVQYRTCPGRPAFPVEPSRDEEAGAEFLRIPTDNRLPPTHPPPWRELPIRNSWTRPPIHLHQHRCPVHSKKGPNPPSCKSRSHQPVGLPWLPKKTAAHS